MYDFSTMVKMTSNSTRVGWSVQQQKKCKACSLSAPAADHPFPDAPPGDLQQVCAALLGIVAPLPGVPVFPAAVCLIISWWGANDQPGRH